MQFYDIWKRDSHAQFVNQGAPYARTTNVFPLGSRRYSSRHFRVRDDGRVDIYYAHRTTVDDYERGKLNYDASWLERRLIASVYPDDTVEFKNLGLGECMLLSSLFGVTIQHNQRRGGYVLKHWMSGKLYPLFKGQRFKLGTFECLTPYEVTQRRVNRKIAQEAMKPYEEFMNTYPVLLEPMDVQGLWEVGSDMVTEACKAQGKERDNYSVATAIPYRTVGDRFFNLIEQKHYVDAAVYFAIAHDVYSARWTLTYTSGPTERGEPWLRSFRTRLKNVMKERLGKDIYYKHDAFNYKAVEAGYLPSSVWELKVTSDGVPVERL